MLAAHLFCVACSSVQRAQTKVSRQPLEKHHREYKTPTNYEQRELGYDPKTGKLITYDHKPRVDLLDAKSGKYAFRWIGYDGKEKTMVFQRADTTDVIVNARALRTPDGNYLYIYQAENLPSSGSYLAGFAVQNFASDVKPMTPGGYAGHMSKQIYQFRAGDWIRFGESFFGKVFNPGQSLNVELVSSAPPGVVECRVHGGQSTLEGATEEMPSALESLLPGYEEWPHGYTIGPVDNLKTFSSQERAAYLLNNLPQFRKAGWITDEAFNRYEYSLKKGDLNKVFARIEQDLKTEQITSEVFAIIQAMK